LSGSSEATAFFQPAQDERAKPLREPALLGSRWIILDRQLVALAEVVPLSKKPGHTEVHQRPEIAH
jgi:hypothetical protein